MCLRARRILRQARPPSSSSINLFDGGLTNSHLDDVEIENDFIHGDYRVIWRSIQNGQGLGGTILRAETARLRPIACRSRIVGRNDLIGSDVAILLSEGVGERIIERKLRGCS